MAFRQRRLTKSASMAPALRLFVVNSLFLPVGLMSGFKATHHIPFFLHPRLG